ncbi:MAG: MBL fold metallo-hydrolase [Acidobacteria bacterium]|nr:MBL fold metallo-hydrolase [Acidobacteriota bacterium]
MKFTVLGSGSTGNAVLISSETTNVLVDAGMSARELLRRLAEMGVQSDQLDGILITHEHGDHIGGLRVLMSSVKCPVYISRITEEAYFDTRAGGTNGDSESSKRKRHYKIEPKRSNQPKSFVLAISISSRLAFRTMRSIILDL